MIVTSGTTTVPAGQTTATIAGAFGTTNYSVFLSIASLTVPWLTDASVTIRNANFFTVEFAVAAPPGGGLLVWDIEGTTVAPQGPATLADYLDDTRRLLRDESSIAGNLYSTTDLIAFINRAMRQRDLDLGMNRVRVSFPMIVNQYAYTIPQILTGTILTGPSFGTLVLNVDVPLGQTSITVSGVFTSGYTVQVNTTWLTAATVENQTSTQFDVEFSIPSDGGTAFIRITGAAAFSTAVPNVIDLLSIIMTPLGTPPSGVRVPLARWPYSKLSYILSTSYPSYPQFYAMYGATGTIMVGPPPAAAYPTEWDFTAFASPLVTLLDTDPLPYPWTDPIPFWAAHFAKLSVQRFDEAKEFAQEAMDRTRRVMARGRPIAIQNPWFDLPKNAR